MSTTSIKLPEALKDQIQHFAAEKRVSAHAFMLRTLEEEVQRLRDRAAFEAEAEAAAAATDAGEPVYALDEVERYIKAKLRARATGEQVERPRPLAATTAKPRKTAAARRRA